MDKKRIAVIANFPNEIREKAQMYFTMVFKEYQTSIEWEYITYQELLTEKLFEKALTMDGLVLSRSDYIITDPIVQEKMRVEMHLVKEFKGPIFGMCFGHHLLEWTYGAEITEQNAQDFLSDQSFQYSPKSDTMTSPPPEPSPFDSQNSSPTAAKETEFVKIFDDTFQIFTPPPIADINAMQHRTRPIYGVDFKMVENATETTFQTAVIILKKFLDHFFTSH